MYSAHIVTENAPRVAGRVMTSRGHLCGQLRSQSAVHFGRTPFRELRLIARDFDQRSSSQLPVRRLRWKKQATGRSGASLLELLLVSALIVLIAGLFYSSIGGFLSSAGRRGAVNILMNAFEHARIAALESGQTVHVGFADKDFPVEEMRYKAFLMFRDTSEEERAAGAKDYLVLKKWTKLPGNVAVKRMTDSVVPESGGQTFAGLKEVLPNTHGDETFPCLSFNSSGAVSGARNSIELFLYEGYFSGDQDIQTRPSGELFEKISLSRYTGRAQFNVTTTNVQ